MTTSNWPDTPRTARMQNRIAREKQMLAWYDGFVDFLSHLDTNLTCWLGILLAFVSTPFWLPLLVYLVSLHTEIEHLQTDSVRDE